jgi:hypothetical protein
MDCYISNEVDKKLIYCFDFCAINLRGHTIDKLERKEKTKKLGMGDGSAACCGIAVISVGYGIGCDTLIQAPGYTSSNNKSVSSSTRRRTAAAAAVAASRASRWRRGATQSLIFVTAAGRERNPCFRTPSDDDGEKVMADRGSPCTQEPTADCGGWLRPTPSPAQAQPRAALPRRRSSQGTLLLRLRRL